MVEQRLVSKEQVLSIPQWTPPLVGDVGGYREDIGKPVPSPYFSHGGRQQAVDARTTHSGMAVNYDRSLRRPLLGVLAQPLRHERKECTWRVWERAGRK